MPMDTPTLLAIIAIWVAMAAVALFILWNRCAPRTCDTCEKELVPPNHEPCLSCLMTTAENDRDGLYGMDPAGWTPKKKQLADKT